MELKKIEKEIRLNFKIEICYNGEECLNLFKERNLKHPINDIPNDFKKVDFIFMDEYMPIMNGLTAAK